MKKIISTRLLSAFMAFVMVFLMIPFSAVTVLAEEETTLPEIDYTPFLIESVNGQAVYNAQTAELCFELQKKAESYVVNNASASLGSIPDKTFSFSYQGNSYYLDSVYVSDPAKQSFVESFLDSTCGFLIGMLNYIDVNGQEKHVMLVSFAGTQKNVGDITTDLAFLAEKVDSDHWYHNGFYEAAKNHYQSIKNVRFSMGNDETYTFNEYVSKLGETGYDYQMIVTGHSLGAAVANIFTSYFVDACGGENVQKNSVAYTFATPLTSSDGTAQRTNVKNVFNYINTYDWVPKVGYGATKTGLNVAQGAREGMDLIYTAGDSNITSRIPLKFTNHKMSSAIYGNILLQANAAIFNHIGTFVIYNNYDEATHTYQRIIFNNGQLIVSGSGALSGNWTENTLVEWAKVKDSCTSLVFATDSSIVEIGDYAFSGMSQLSNELHLPETVTTVGNYAFFYCGFEGDLIIHAKMQEIGINAFNGCTNLDSINAQAATAMTWGYGAFANCVGQHDLLLPVEDSGTDLAKIFKTYYVQDNNGSYLIDVDNATSGNVVLPKDKIYIGRIEEDKLKERPDYDFHYLLTPGHTDTADNIQALATKTIIDVATIDESGCITISDSCQSDTEFTVVVMDNYKGNPYFSVYDSNRFIHFTVGTVNNYFEGGLGTEERPYLIKNYDQLKRINNDLSAHYRLVADIDCTNEPAWQTLGDSSNPFTGFIDGNGYTISNMSGGGFVAYNSGKIKNLSFYKAILSDSAGMYEGGIIANSNNEKGYITNCSVIECNRSLSCSGTGWEVSVMVGGICGKNYGNIERCEVIKSIFSGYANTSYDSNYFNVLGCCGALAGFTGGGTVQDCYVFGNNISLTLKHRVYDKAIGAGTKTYAYFRMGGVFGRNDTTQLVRIVAENNTVNSPIHQWDETGKGNDINPSNLYFADKNGFSGAKINKAEYYIDCYCDNDIDSYVPYIKTYSQFESNQSIFVENKWSFEGGKISVVSPTIDAISFTESYIDADLITELPSKKHYYIGESLNIYGLEVVDSIENGYKISSLNYYQSGTQTIEVTYVTGYGTFRDTFTVTVDNIIPQTVIVQPKEDYYSINDSLSVSDFTATIYYNNGAVEILNSLAKNESNFVNFVDFINLLDTTGVHELQLTYTYAYMTEDGQIPPASTSTTVYVAVNVNCDCLSTTRLSVIPATVSEYGYTGDLVCSTCLSIVEEGSIIDMLECTDHNFQNGICTACQQLNATLKARSITLGGMIGMNFYFEIDPAIVSNNAAYVNFTVAGGRNIQFPVSRGVVDTTSMPGTTLYCFSCPLYATEMSDVVVAKIVMGENESKAYERTVISYANIILNGAYDDEDKAVVKAMLNYGASSQLEFDHNTENLANSGLDAQDKEIPDVTANDFATTITSANLDGIGKYYAASLSLGSETTITAYFELADGVGVNDITFTLGSRVLTSTPEIIGGKTYAAVIINGISADKLDDVFTVTATMGNSSGTFQCSAFRYCYSVMKAQDGVYTETLKNVLKTMYAYNQATIAYLNKNA